MIEAGLTQSRRAAKVGIESDPAVLRVFVPSCESIFYDHDSARSGDIGDDQETWLQTTVTGPGTLTFDYKLSCDAGDEYAFSIDGQYRSGRAGSQDWTESGPWTITGAGTHTIRWKFIKDSSGSSGSDCLWIDRIRWTGAMPDGEGWDRIEYAYDAAGRRIEKKVDGATQVKYVYDGDHIIAEYNSAGTLLRKYVHGPCVDEPICMIEASGTYAGTHYYHYDALGSCVAMTNSAGNVTQLYEYSVYGQVAASDESHPNRFMFTGREFDKDTGLYYYRARYYHPEIGRFLQTDPIGYGAGMNLYWYCNSNPVRFTDPYGASPGEAKGVSFWGATCPDGPAFEFSSNDWVNSFPMYSAQGVLATLEKLKGEGADLSQVYFHEHADPTNFVRQTDPDTGTTYIVGSGGITGMKFGNDIIPIDANESFWKELGALLPEGATIHFRSCWAGEDPCVLVKLAQLTGHPVTGWMGLVHDTGQDPLGPNYTCGGDLRMADPNGTWSIVWTSTVYADDAWRKQFPGIYVPIPNPTPQPY